MYQDLHLIKGELKVCTPSNPQSLFFNLILTLAFPRGPPLSKWQVDMSSSQLLNILNPSWPLSTTQILLSSYLLGQSAVHIQEIQTLASEREMRDKKGEPQERWVHLFGPSVGSWEWVWSLPLLRREQSTNYATSRNRSLLLLPRFYKCSWDTK